MILCGRLEAETFTINTPGGPVQVDIGHVGPRGSLVTPGSPTPPDFRPPTIFSAPLPSGSGARALGLGGAFTAIADDATAASWNPGGLIQLERPELSVVFRSSMEVNDHTSSAESYQVGRDEFYGQNLNYFSFVCPFRVSGVNCVFSANLQEAYDFTQRFTADLSDRSLSSSADLSSETYRQTIVEHYQQSGSVYAGSIIEIDVTSYLKTDVGSYLQGLLATEMLTSLEFKQQGVIDAITPVLAVELTPKFSIGAAINIYEDNSESGHRISSRTVAGYSGDSLGTYDIMDHRTTSGSYSYEGYIRIPPGGGVPVWVNVPISDSGNYPVFEENVPSQEDAGVEFDGIYEELNQYDNLAGNNLTFGALWTVSRYLSLGFGIDFPWTASAQQTKTVRNTITTYNESRSEVLDVSETEYEETKKIEFGFPLYWAVGAVWRWNNRLYTTLDVSQTLWSDFSFQAEGEDKLNPLDGSIYGVNAVDDCWAVRCGVEYLLVLMKTEIPFRAGLSWEQRPAIGEPDEYLGFSLGSGLSFGKDPGKLILDVAYMYSRGNDVLDSLVADVEGLNTDVTKHQVYMSCIYHF